MMIVTIDFKNEERESLFFCNFRHFFENYLRNTPANNLGLLYLQTTQKKGEKALKKNYLKLSTKSSKS